MPIVKGDVHATIFSFPKRTLSSAVERDTHNVKVTGSIPVGSTTMSYGVTVTQQILILFFKVRILVRHQMDIIEIQWGSKQGITQFDRLCNTKEENLERDKEVHMVDVAQLEEH
jgi:hypothetical protein